MQNLYSKSLPLNPIKINMKFGLQTIIKIILHEDFYYSTSIKYQLIHYVFRYLHNQLEELVIKSTKWSARRTEFINFDKSNTIREYENLYGYKFLSPISYGTIFYGTPREAHLQLLIRNLCDWYSIWIIQFSLVTPRVRNHDV